MYSVNLVLVLFVLILSIRAEIDQGVPTFRKMNFKPPTKPCFQIHKQCIDVCQSFGTRYKYCLSDCLIKSGIGKCDSPNSKPDTENINDPITDSGDAVWEGDMLLTDEQVDLLFGKGRKAEKRLEYRWSNGLIPFSIKDDARANTKLILEALQHWMKNTCLQFTNVEEDSKFPHIIFQSGRGCHSRVGMQKKRNPHGQTVTLGHGCEQVGKIIHEVGHAIGFYHEHSRPDRDKYVKIVMENIDQKHAKNFVFAKNINPYGITYDLDSIMHYHSREFTKNGKNTVIPLNPLKQYDIGQRKGLSFLDVKLANIMYNCSDHCDSDIICQNDGFLDKSCECQCAPNFRGSVCEKYIAPQETTCGGIKTDPEIIKTPNYPGHYPAESKCIWWITAPSSQRVNIQFHSFHIGPRHPKTFACQDDVVEIRASNSYDGDIYCGSEQHGKTITSTANQLIVMFHSKFGRHQGFEATIRFV